MMFRYIRKFTVFVVKYWIPFILWAVVIYSFSSNPTVKTSEIHWEDFVVKKTAHVVEYFIFSLLLYRGLINSKVRSEKAIVIAIIGTFIYGLTDEWHQFFTPGREPRLRDVLIDTSGSLFFVYSFKSIILKNEKLVHLAKVVQLIR
jgi:VanZ family protein